MRILKLVLFVSLALYVLAFGARVWARKFYIWLPGYVTWSIRDERASRGPVHVFFFYTDHFEPAAHSGRVQRWVEEYPKLADRHRDSRGRPLQHTWFYPGEQPLEPNMLALQKLVAAGYGEVELHLHHGNDTLDSARSRYQAAISFFQKFGFLKTVDGETRFGFIHGNNGLDNSMGARVCGVNRELQLLREMGCYADFTFVSLWRDAQPPYVNRIFEVVDDDRPKSYAQGVPLQAGRAVGGDLVIFQGPLVMAGTLDPRKLFVQVEDGDIHPGVPVTARRVDSWIRANIHVEGRPEWIFVKVHGHAASSEADLEETLGQNLDRALRYLEDRYNDGTRYVLHYVTAREAYNVARAAATNLQGDPRQYLDWMIKPYLAGAAARRAAAASSTVFPQGAGREGKPWSTR